MLEKVLGKREKFIGKGSRRGRRGKRQVGSLNHTFRYIYVDFCREYHKVLVIDI